MSWNLVHMKDIPCPHLLWKFQDKICKSPVTCTCPKFLCCQKTHASPLGVNLPTVAKTFGKQTLCDKHQFLSNCVLHYNVGEEVHKPNEALKVVKEGWIEHFSMYQEWTYQEVNAFSALCNSTKVQKI